MDCWERRFWKSEVTCTNAELSCMFDTAGSVRRRVKQWSCAQRRNLARAKISSIGDCRVEI